jgi:hypothetical protein
MIKQMNLRGGFTKEEEVIEKPVSEHGKSERK